MGPIYKIRIGHNDKGRNSAWYLERVVIQRHAVKPVKKSKSGSRASSLSRPETPEFEEYYFNVNNWLSKTDGDKQIVREVLATDADGNPLFDLDGMF